jgi:hypothetical protein
MRRVTAAWLLTLALAGSVLFALPASRAEASAGYASPYTFEQTFGSAMRLLRVDLGCAITEKDVENGYVLFDYTSPESGKRVHHGSIEVVRGKQGSQVTVQLVTLPQYHEQMIVDALAKKLSSEHGAPLPLPVLPAPVVPADAGADGASGASGA